jgi:NADPH-dependent 2,4-dienoyl-CoA reductase/sulfur reductase-like enzyme
VEAGLIQKKSPAPGTGTGKSLAIIGAGPIGIEAALRGLAGGWRVTVFEKDVIGGHQLITFVFSPRSRTTSRLNC